MAYFQIFPSHLFLFGEKQKVREKEKHRGVFRLRRQSEYRLARPAKMRYTVADLEQRMGNAATSERVRLNKQLITVQAQSEELRLYEEKIHHLADQMIAINLNDGFKKNYEIFRDVLSKVK